MLWKCKEYKGVHFPSACINKGLRHPNFTKNGYFKDGQEFITREIEEGLQ